MLLLVSHLNYPGGEALELLHTVAYEEKNVKVHMDVFTCMTGATRFIEKPTWKYDKSEDDESLQDVYFWKNFTYILQDHPQVPLGLHNFKIIAQQRGFKRPSIQSIIEKLKTNSIWNLEWLTEEKIWILKNVRNG